MIKVSTAPLLTAVLLSFIAGPALAAACGAGSSALSQLSAAGGPGALEAIVVATPAPRLAPRSGLYDVATYDTTAADILITGLAESARKTGRTNASLLLLRLAKEGTPAEKLEFMSARHKPYTFPARFTLAVKAGGVCRTVAELFCKLSCIHTGTNQESCKEECRTIFVTSCD